MRKKKFIHNCPPKKYRRKLSKPERRAWWYNLTPEQQEEYIEKRQVQKAKSRENMPERVLVYNPTYPWMTEGVNDTNREQWQKMIANKNPWLCLGAIQ